jgi:hypothetical protein
MASPAQILANRANSAHSTGPRTEAGKARSAANALKHGFTARELVVREQDRDEFNALSARLSAELAPEGAVEDLLFRGILRAAWNIHRIPLIAAELAAQPDDGAEGANAAQFESLQRHLGTSESRLHRNLNALRRWQTARAQRAASAGSQNESSMTAS